MYCPMLFIIPQIERIDFKPKKLLGLLCKYVQFNFENKVCPHVLKLLFYNDNTFHFNPFLNKFFSQLKANRIHPICKKKICIKHSV